MLFCKSSTVNVGTIALICTTSCVVATIASFLFSSCFVYPQAIGPRPDLQALPCEKDLRHGRVSRALSRSSALAVILQRRIVRVVRPAVKDRSFNIGKR